MRAKIDDDEGLFLGVQQWQRFRRFGIGPRKRTFRLENVRAALCANLSSANFDKGG